MSRMPHEFAERTISHEELQAYIARGQALRAAYVARTLRALGRVLIGRGARRDNNQKAPGMTGHVA